VIVEMAREQDSIAFASQRPEEVALEKFSTKGFNKLTLEELALTQISPTWREEFQRVVGESWDLYQPKAAERLKRANFDMKWLTKRTDNAFNPLFTAVARGDLARVSEYLRINDLPTCVDAVDDTKKTCLHLACREGHLELVELLLSKGWQAEARDRMLNTPLHLACSRGHAPIVASLLRKRVDTQAGDSAGRKAVHYACNALDSEALKILLKQDRDCVHYVDGSGRGPMHYVVFNSSARQIDFIRVLLENGCEVDPVDSLGRTPLHYACEASRSRCIPMLLKNAAKLTVKDTAGKTPVDLVKNDQIHQIISLYVKPEGEKEAGFLHPAAKGATAPQTVSPYSQNSPPKTRPKQSPSEPVLQLPPNKQERRDSLLNLLKRVQEIGVNAQQHLKKPQLFSGAWMEGILSPGALLQALGGSSPAEAVLKVFNVLFPYPKQLPVPQGDEYAIYEFYGEALGGAHPMVMESEEFVEQRPIAGAETRSSLVQDDRRVKELESRLAAQDRELARLRRELQSSERRAKDTDQMTSLQEALEAAEGDKELALAAKLRLQEEVSTLRKEIDRFKAVNETLGKQLATVPKPEDLEDLKKALADKEVKDRALRFKSGLLFLKSLDAKVESAPAVESEIHLNDGQVIDRLSAALIALKPGLKQRLTDVDMNADGSVTKSEMTKALDKLGISPQDILSLLRIAGFRPGINTASIQSFVQVVTTWESRKAELVSKLFIKLKAKFRGKPLEDLFEMMDINRDGTINFAELAEACNMLKLNISREDRHAIFAVLDEDHSGSISLDELKAQIETAGEEVEAEKEEISEAVLDEEEDELNDKDEDVPEDVSLQGDFEPDSVGESNFKKSQKTPLKAQAKIQTKTPEDSVEIDDKEEIPIVRTKQPNFPAPIKSPSKAPIPVPTKPAVKEQSAPSPIQAVKTLYGRLSLQIVKARELPEGKYAVQCTLAGSDGPQRTEFLQGSSPEWKFRGRFKVDGIKSNAVSEAIKVELFGASGVDATVSIPWLKCISQPGNWAVNSEFAVKDKAGKQKGYILIQLKWLPRDTVRLEGSGDLYILPLGGIDLKSCLVLFSLAGKTTRTAASGPPWTETLCLRDIKLAITRAIPPLAVTIVDFQSQKEVIKSSFNWESALAAPNVMSQEIKMSLSSTMSLVLKMKWRPFTEEEERVIKCATKIQAWWRGKKAREQVKGLKAASRRLISRRGVAVDGKFYMVNVTTDLEGKTVADLHPVGDPSIPMYTLLDSLEINPEQAGEITAGVGDKLAFGDSRVGSLEPALRGDLGVKVTGAVGLDGVMLKFVIGSAFVHSLAGPPWPRPMMIQNVSTPKTATQVVITVIELSNRKEMFQRTCDFKAAFGAPNAWSTDVLVDLSEACKLKVQFQWLPYPEESKAAETAATKLQAVWKGKQARSITASSTTRTRKAAIARQGLKSENGHYYLLSYYEDGKGIGVALHQADDPGVPLYEEIDYKVVNKEPLEQLQARVKVAADGKLIL